MSRMPKIECAICGRSVEKITVWELPAHTGFQIDVFCHGDKDTMTLTSHQIEGMSKAEYESMWQGTGLAFAMKRRANPSLMLQHNRRIEP